MNRVSVTHAATFLLAVALLFLAGCDKSPAPVAEPGAETSAEAAHSGIELPEGFSATVFAESLGRARHIAVSSNGDVYVALREPHAETGHGTVALRDEDGDGIADIIETFGSFTGTGVEVHGEWLYRSSDTAVYRWKLEPGQLVPSGDSELVAGGFPEQRSHAAKALALDDEGLLYLNSGAPSNACQDPPRQEGAPGQDPCPQLERGGGIWRFTTGTTGQDQMADGIRFATGLRNTVAMAWNPTAKALYAVPHGRDQLDTLWPDHFDAEDNARLPAEQFHRVEEGLDAGWPYTYYDPFRDERMVAPEYGGDGETPAEPGRYAEPIMTFPAHWAPNDLVFYDADAFPERYHGGAFVAFHGSWNRAPLPQGGYNVVFVPFDGALPSGDYEVFADGFAGKETVRSPREARHRPMGLAVGPSGELFIADSQQGRVWRVTHGE